MGDVCIALFSLYFSGFRFLSPLLCSVPQCYQRMKLHGVGLGLTYGMVRCGSWSGVTASQSAHNGSPFLVPSSSMRDCAFRFFGVGGGCAPFPPAAEIRERRCSLLWLRMGCKKDILTPLYRKRFKSLRNRSVMPKKKIVNERLSAVFVPFKFLLVESTVD